MTARQAVLDLSAWRISYGEHVVDFVIHHPPAERSWVHVGYPLVMADEMVSSVLVHNDTDSGSESCIQRIAEAPLVYSIVRTAAAAWAPLDPLPDLPCDCCVLRHAPRQIELCSAIRTKF